MKTKLGMTAAMALAAATLSACGNSTEDYCNSLEEAQNDFASLEGGDFAQFGDALDQLRDIGENAPDEVAEDWDTMVGAFDDLEQALEDAGLTFEDLGNPAELDPEQIEALSGDAFTGLQNEEVDAASQNIEQHADEECGIQLN